jgi:hypothetical protein
MTEKKTEDGPGGIQLVIDTSNPDTPAMVYSEKQKHSSTFDCATGSGVLAGLGREEDLELDHEQLAWLDGFSDEVDEAYSAARAGLPEYR